MKKIVSVIQPFDAVQNLFVYDEDKKIDTIQTTLDTIGEDLISLSDKYETPDVNLIGGAKFLRGIKKQIEDIEILKYNKNNLNISIIKG